MTKSLISVLIAGLFMTGCAELGTQSKTLKKDVNAEIASQKTAIANQPTPAVIREHLDTPYLDFKPVGLSTERGSVSVKASDVPFTTLVSEVASKSGYSLAYTTNVKAAPITIDLSKASPEHAIRTMAFLAGYVAVFDKAKRSVTISDAATYTFRLPTSILQQIGSSYSVGGNPVSSGGASGGSQSAGAGMTADFTISGKSGNSAQSATGAGSNTSKDPVKMMLQSVAGSGADISIVNDSGLVTVRGNSQMLRRVSDFLKDYCKEALTQVEIEASLVEVSLSDNFEYGVDWSRILGTMGGSLALEVNTLPNGWQDPGQRAPFRATYSKGSISSVVAAMKQYADVKVISQPRVMAVNHTPASLFDGTQQPYLGSVSTTTTANTGTAQTAGNVSYVVDGLSLSLQADVLDASRAQITLLPVMSTIGEKMQFDMGDNKLTAYVQSNKQTFMRVMAENGKTLILGGIRYTKVAGTKDTVIPVIGEGRKSDKQVKELIILLRSHILPSTDYEPLIGESV